MIEVTDDDHAAMALIREIFETAPAEQTIADTVAQAFATHRTQAAKAERDRLQSRIEALEAALRSVAKTCREEIPLPYVGKMREVLLRNLAEWCEQALESSDA